MMNHSLRYVGIAACASALLLGTPSKSHAIFGWLKGCCSPRTAYMPVAPAPVAQTCQYMPVTSYRTVYKQVPVTTYQPVTSRSWCSCQPVTTYRPVTTYVTQAQQVAFTTYKPVYAAVAVPATTTYNAPAAVSYTQPAAPCCGGAATPISAPMTSAPMTLGGPPAAGAYTPPAVTAPGYGAPTPQPTLPAGPPSGGTTQQSQKPTPAPEPANGDGQPTGYGYPASNPPRFIPPSERTTALPSYDRGTRSYNTASHATGQWQAQRAQTFANPANTQSRVAISQPALSPAATATTGSQYRWRPAQN